MLHASSTLVIIHSTQPGQKSQLIVGDYYSSPLLECESFGRENLGKVWEGNGTKKRGKKKDLDIFFCFWESIPDGVQG